MPYRAPMLGTQYLRSRYPTRARRNSTGYPQAFSKRESRHRCRWSFGGHPLGRFPQYLLVDRFEMVRLDASYLIVGGLVMLLLGQAAVFWPAMRASRVPPAVAVRGAGNFTRVN
jgi:hypothetical protein